MAYNSNPEPQFNQNRKGIPRPQNVKSAQNQTVATESGSRRDQAGGSGSVGENKKQFLSYFTNKLKSKNGDPVNSRNSGNEHFFNNPNHSAAVYGGGVENPANEYFSGADLASPKKSGLNGLKFSN